MKAYNKKSEVIADIFKKKCHELWSRSQIIDHLQNHYDYTYETSLTYYEDLIQHIEKLGLEQYETNLQQALEFMDYNIQQLTEPEQSFVRLQWLKERNKIAGLHINKIQVDTTITHIDTIRIHSTPQPKAITEGDITEAGFTQLENNTPDLLTNGKEEE